MRLKKIDDTGKPYKIYAEVLESEAIDQFVKAMEQDFIVQGALMPDAHAGYTLPVGGVVACDGVVVPSYVGYDIGCGMCAVPTTFKREDIEAHKKAIFDQIYRDVPTGFSHNKTSTEWSYTGNVSDFVRDLYKSGAPQKQIGTLGGGNHFIEIGYDETNVVWIILHSGSRNVGHKIATHYMKVASGDGKAREGHYGLRVDSDAGRDYINDLAFGLQFALDNRVMMIQRIEKAILHALKCIDPFFHFGQADWAGLINRNHNHAELKDGLWIHRKGATHAEEGMMGVIPGNMRDGSFIVRGRGNPESLWSSSHGAGRLLSRKKAKAELSLDDFEKTMTQAGVMALVKDSTLDESPMAYKNIYQVMMLQTDLVMCVHHVRPLINVKG